MNERILELENQAHELAWQEWKHLPESNDGTRMDSQALARFKNKFAELIVRECMRMCDVAAVGYESHDLIKEANGCVLASKYIAENFGVEE